MERSPPSPTALVVRSPRQTVSLLRGRRSKPQPHGEASGSPLAGGAGAGLAAGEHGPNPSEVYGFVGSITTVIATVIYLVWAYTPEPWLESMGITYYPSKYWALAVPSFVVVAVVLLMVLYMGLNFMATPPPSSFNTIFDEYSRERTTFTPAAGIEKPIEPISDIGIDQINSIMFGDQ